MPERLMRRALALAHAARFLPAPNPRVGCVLARAGAIIGEGATQIAGGHHAEIVALQHARQAGHDVRGCTAFVTLEPCAHFGRTPPCSAALIAAGIGEVFVAVQDPNPLTAGQGMAQLRAAGIAVHCGLLEQEALSLNAGFFKRMETGRPWVRVKQAASLDGRVALNNGQSQWITGEAARADNWQYRAQSCAILSGIGTVLADDPLLDDRALAAPRQVTRIILDSDLRTPPTARLFRSPAPVWIATLDRSSQRGWSERRDALQTAGALCHCLPAMDARDIGSGAGDPAGRPYTTAGTRGIDLNALLAWLGGAAMNEIHVEAGPKLSSVFLRAYSEDHLADEWLLYLAPMLIGPGQSSFDAPPLTDLAQAERWRIHACDKVGEDLRLQLLH